MRSLTTPGLKKIKVVEAVATRWKKLALALGFKLSAIDSIDSGYFDAERDCDFMLKKWLEWEDATVTWNTLIIALEKADYISLTEDLMKGKSPNLDHSSMHLLFCSICHKIYLHVLVETD